MKSVLITGANGFIGSCLLKFLKPDLDLDIFTTDIVGGSAIDFVADLRDLESLRFIKEIAPQVVIHLGAQSSVPASLIDPLEDFAVNAMGTMNLISTLSGQGIENFIYVNSGGAIYGSDSLLPIDENSPTKPVSPYGISKLTGEYISRNFAERFGIDWSSLALSNCYGNFSLNPKGVIFEFYKRLFENAQSSIFGRDVTRDFIFIDDVLEAIKLAMLTPTNCRVNISSGTETTLENLYNLMCSILGKEIQPLVKSPINGQVLRSCLDNHLARELLGWAPEVSLDQGLRRIIAVSQNEGAAG
jgi:UDP-glucose 4-epimerase